MAEARERVAALNEQARKQADEKAWADAQRAGTVSAFNSYIQNFASGAHVAEARQRITALNEQARKALDDKAWADADRAGTVAAFNTYLQSYASGAHAADARARIAALDEQARKDADEKAWTDAQRTNTAAAFNGYIQNFSSGAHVAEARQRAATLEAEARKAADDKAWADAQKAGTSSAYSTYLQNFGTGAYAAEARQRVATIDAQGRREVPTVDIQKTCQAAAGVMVSLLGGSTTDQDVKGCLDFGAKGPRADHQGPGDVFGGRQIALHAVGRLPPELCGVAHLPRDGERRSQDAGGRTQQAVDHDAAEGAPGPQLVSRVAGPRLARRFSCRLVR